MKHEILMVIGTIIIAFLVIAGCVGTSPYSVEYSTDKEGGWPLPTLIVGIKGPAADLGVIFSNPEGFTKTIFISKGSLIDNYESIKFPMTENIDISSPPTGTYNLVIKTINPENVVYKTDINFKPPILQITNAEIRLSKLGPLKSSVWYEHGYDYSLNKYSINVKNDGELPVVFDKALVVINNREIDIPPFSNALWSRQNGIIQGFAIGSKPITLGGAPQSATVKLFSDGKEVVSSNVNIIMES